ncbi:hypothetical protein BDB01DRAFT_793285 [Pilobolus umbonatus]|nr:hypothetical protein BDB01DRAFT_793285 [Pilobolus umbonatus]
MSFKALFKKLKGSTCQDTGSYLPTMTDYDQKMCSRVVIDLSLTTTPKHHQYTYKRTRRVSGTFSGLPLLRVPIPMATLSASTSHPMDLFFGDEQSTYCFHLSDDIAMRRVISLCERKPSPQLDSSELNEVANKLWNEDPSLCPIEEIAQWLGSNEPYRERVLTYYMQYFDFTHRQLDEAFRMLCNKLFFKAESQQLDRIVESFAKRYYECNPSTVFQSVDIVYVVSYSLLLLNTDLHVVSDWMNRMTKSVFIKNTMETIQGLPSGLSSSRSSDNSLLNSSYSLYDMYAETSDVSKASKKMELLKIENTLKEMYVSVKAQRIDRVQLMTPKESKRMDKKRQSLVGSIQEIIDQVGLKQGLVMRKHVMESTDKKARNRQWQLCYLVMNESELIMYRACQDKSRRRKSVMSSTSSVQTIMGDHQWTPNENCPALDRIEMSHTHTVALPHPGWNSQRPHVFRMETSEGGIWLFESIDMFAVQAWVESANKVAARISKSPLKGAISNVDYGWGPMWDKYSGIENVPLWYPTAPCMIQSNLNLKDQHKDILSQIECLDQEWIKHKSLQKLSQKNSKCMQSFVNWERRSDYLLKELTKYQCYRDHLEQESTLNVLEIH